MAHTCPRCRGARAERRTPRSYRERAALAMLGYHPYRCLDCERRFLNRPSARAAGGDAGEVEAPAPAMPRRVPAPAPDRAPTLAIATAASRESRHRRRPRWVVDAGNGPLGRSEVYAIVLTGMLLLLVAFAVLRLVWPDAVGGVRLGGD